MLEDEAQEYQNISETKCRHEEALRIFVSHIKYQSEDFQNTWIAVQNF